MQEMKAEGHGEDRKVVTVSGGSVFDPHLLHVCRQALVTIL